MKFVTFNIQYGFGADGKYDLSRIPPAVAGADVIALQEVERFWQRSGMVDQPALIAQALPDYHWVYGPNLDMDASYQDETGRLVSRRKQFGNMLLCKSPILSSRNFLLPKLGTIHHHGIQQGALEAVIMVEDGPLRLYSIHLGHLASGIRRQQLDVFLDIHKNAPAQGGVWCGIHPDKTSGWIEEAEPPMPKRTILMGDFNLRHDSREYEMLVGPKSAEFGRISLNDGFADSWVLAGHNEEDGATNTTNREDRRDAARIDYCFVTAELSNCVTEARIDSGCTASDHAPYWTTLRL